MKHKILSSLAAISLALLLCSCGNNDDEPKNTEPTDAITTAISFTEAPADTAQTSDTASEYDKLLAVSEELDSLRTSYSKLTIGLYFALIMTTSYLLTISLSLLSVVKLSIILY